MLRGSRSLLVSMVTPHHPHYRAVARQKAQTFPARVEVERVNKEIARLMVIRDTLVDTELHIGRTANGRFAINPLKRARISTQVLDLKRRKDLLLQYIQRNEMINDMLASGEVEPDTDVTAKMEAWTLNRELELGVTQPA